MADPEWNQMENRDLDPDYIVFGFAQKEKDLEKCQNRTECIYKLIPINKLQIDRWRSVVFIKYRTKALYVHVQCTLYRVQGSPLSSLMYCVHNVYNIWNVCPILNEDDTFSSIYLWFIYAYTFTNNRIILKKKIP